MKKIKKIHHNVARGILYGMVLALLLWQGHALFVQAEAPIAKQDLFFSQSKSDVDYKTSRNEVVPTEKEIVPTVIVESNPNQSNSSNNVLQAKAALLAKVDPVTNRQQIIFEKNGSKSLPIASITKIMTSYVALSVFDSKQVITIPKSVIYESWPSKKFIGGEKFKLNDLVLGMLVESNNDSARAIADEYGRSTFIELMNGYADTLNLRNTHFVNPDGTDPIDGSIQNRSSARDVANLAAAFFNNFPAFSNSGSMQKLELRDVSGTPHHVAYSTNILLPSLSSRFDVHIGKTGTTDAALRNLVLLLDDSKSGSRYVAVILGSPDNFRDMQELLGKIDN